MKTTCALLLVLALAGGCKRHNVRPQAGEAQKILTEFVTPNADTTALSNQLRPKAEDYEAAFESASAEKLKANLEPMWDSGKLALKPLPGATEVDVWGATQAELQSGDGNASHCPEDYRKVAGKIRSDVMIYCFSFKKPGEHAGLAGDGLVYIKDHWAFFPKAYRYLN